MAPVPTQGGPWLVQWIRQQAVDDARVWAVLSLAGLGLFVVLRFLYATLRVAASVILPGQSLRSFGAKKGAWAVVTGSTSGIGAEFAAQLARAGFRVVLVSRDAAKLQAQAKEITSKSGTETLTFAIDFVDATQEEYANLAKLLAPLDIGVLVNNVGQSHAYPEYFVNLPPEENERIVAINVASMVRLTRIIAPGMVARKRGLILNFSSFSGHVRAPLLSTYAGTKAFLSSFSTALGHELKQHNITVSCLNAYYVSTAMAKMRPSFLAPTPRAYVRSVLGHIGNGGGSAGGPPHQATPYPSHALVQWVIDNLLPWSLLLSITESGHLDVRRRAIAKRKRLDQQAKKQ